MNSSIASVQVSDMLSPIVNINQATNFQFFPNPTSDALRFNALLQDINIYNLAGKLLRTYAGWNNEIYISELETGTYIFKGKLNNKETISQLWQKK